MLFAPLLFYSMAWITGRLIISICSVKTKLNEGFIIFIGIGQARSQFSLGIGGWGKASGHIEFSEFYLYNINNNRSDISGNE